MGKNLSFLICREDRIIRRGKLLVFEVMYDSKKDPGSLLCQESSL